MFHSSSHKLFKYHHDSSPCGRDPFPKCFTEMHPLGCNYWLKLSVDPEFPQVPLVQEGCLHPFTYLNKFMPISEHA